MRQIFLKVLYILILILKIRYKNISSTPGRKFSCNSSGKIANQTGINT